MVIKQQMIPNVNLSYYGNIDLDNTDTYCDIIECIELEYANYMHYTYCN